MRARWPRCPGAGCCRWSKLMAMVSAPSRSRAHSRRSIPGATASQRRGGRGAPGGRDHAADPGLEAALAGRRSAGSSRHDLRPTIGDPVALGAGALATDRPFHVEHRHRDGARRGAGGTVRRLAAAASAARVAPGGKVIFTHFHSADTDPASVTVQWERFRGRHRGACRAVRRWCTPPTARAPFAGRAFAGDLVRPGIFLYGGSAGRPPRRRRWRRSGRGCWRCAGSGRGDRELRRDVASGPRHDGWPRWPSATRTDFRARCRQRAPRRPRLVELGGRSGAGHGARHDGHDDGRHRTKRRAPGRRGDGLRRAASPSTSRRRPPAPSPTSC